MVSSQKRILSHHASPHLRLLISLAPLLFLCSDVELVLGFTVDGDSPCGGTHSKSIINETSFSSVLTENKDPIPVLFGITINELSQIDDAEESFTADFYISLFYQDPNLHKSPDWSLLDRDGEVALNESSHTWNQLELDLKTQDSSSTLLQISKGRNFTVPSGNTWGLIPGNPDWAWVQTELRYRGSFRTTFDLRDFPFDTQVVDIVFELQAGTVSEYYFVAPEDFSELVPASTRKPTGFTLSTGCLRSSSLYYETFDEVYSQMTFAVSVHRESGSVYGIRIISTLAITTMMTFFMYAFELTDTGRQSNTATFFLAAVAYLFVVDLPSLPYTTRLDNFILVSLLANLDLFAWFTLVYVLVNDKIEPRTTDEAKAWLKSLEGVCTFFMLFWYIGWSAYTLSFSLNYIVILYANCTLLLAILVLAFFISRFYSRTVWCQVYIDFQNTTVSRNECIKDSNAFFNTLPSSFPKPGKKRALTSLSKILYKDYIELEVDADPSMVGSDVRRTIIRRLDAAAYAQDRERHRRAARDRKRKPRSHAVKENSPSSGTAAVKQVASAPHTEQQSEGKEISEDTQGWTPFHKSNMRLGDFLGNFRFQVRPPVPSSWFSRPFGSQHVLYVAVADVDLGASFPAAAHDDCGPDQLTVGMERTDTNASASIAFAKGISFTKNGELLTSTDDKNLNTWCSQGAVHHLKPEELDEQMHLIRKVRLQKMDEFAERGLQVKDIRIKYRPATIFDRFCASRRQDGSDDSDDEDFEHDEEGHQQEEDLPPTVHSVSFGPRQPSPSQSSAGIRTPQGQATPQQPGLQHPQSTTTTGGGAPTSRRGTIAPGEEQSHSDLDLPKEQTPAANPLVTEGNP